MYKEWIDSLMKVKLFEDIKKNELEDMLNCLRPKVSHYHKGEYITRIGDPFTGIGIVLDGEVTVTKENAVGNRVIMGKFEKGDLFGEMIAFSSKDEWVATVVAAKDCKIFFLSSEKIIGSCSKVCQAHRKLIQNMLMIISHKALILSRKIEYLSIKSIRGKISTYLLEQYHKNGKSTFMIPLKRNELAAFLSVSRPSLSREMIKMKEENMIDFYRSSFKILDLEALKKCIGI